MWMFPASDIFVFQICLVRGKKKKGAKENYDGACSLFQTTFNLLQSDCLASTEKGQSCSPLFEAELQLMRGAAHIFQNPIPYSYFLCLEADLWLVINPWSHGGRDRWVTGARWEKSVQFSRERLCLAGQPKGFEVGKTEKHCS